MDDPLETSLIVSGIGMLALFLALAFLTGLMYAMTALIKDQPEVVDSSVGESVELKLRAGAIAVALARTEYETGTAPPVTWGGGAGASGGPGAEGAASAWRTLHHQRQLTRTSHIRRRG